MGPGPRDRLHPAVEGKDLGFDQVSGWDGLGKGACDAERFRAFIMRGNVVDLAVAVVIGVAFGAVITALVADIVTPENNGRKVEHPSAETKSTRA